MSNKFKNFVDCCRSRQIDLGRLVFYEHSKTSTDAIRRAVARTRRAFEVVE